MGDVTRIDIEIDRTKLYTRRFNGDPEAKQLCCNCFLAECDELGCCLSGCECSQEHGDHKC